MLSSLALATVFQSQPIIYDLYLGDTVIGKSEYVRSENGDITSKSSMNVQGFVLDSTATLHIEKGQITSFVSRDNTSQNGKVLRTLGTKYENGQGVISGTGIPERKFTVRPTLPMFSNYHPQLLEGLSKKIDFTKATKQSITLYVMEAGQEAPLTFVPGKSRTVTIGDRNETIRYCTLELGELKIEMAFNEGGDYLGMFVPSQKLTCVLSGYKGIFADPLAAHRDLSPVAFQTKSSDIRIPLRDGVETVATIVRPTKPGKYPIVLNRTPYGRKTTLTDADMFASRGYIFIAQDVRGTGESKGSFDPFVHEQKDGYDTLDWISKQEWCDGNVGMIGASYGGYVQWAAAVEQHPVLKCLIPQVSPPSSAMWNIPYERGVPMMMTDLWWLRIVDNPEGQNLLGALDAVKNLKKMVTLPLKDLDNQVLGFNSKIFDTWMSRDTGAKWPGFHFDDKMKSVKIPALHISGWFDGDEIGTQRNWDLVTRGGNKSQSLIYGPWTHFFNTTRILGDVDFGESAIMELDSVYLRWFDHWLKKRPVGLEKTPKVQYFVMGENKWHTSATWPPAEGNLTNLFVKFGKKSTGFRSTATMSTTKPTRTTQVATTYDPSKEKVEVDTLDVGDTSGSIFVDKSNFGNDTIVIRSAPFTKDTIVTGTMRFAFDFTCSAVDTDFFVFAFDQTQRGKYFPAFRPAKLRASYLTSVDKRTPLVPGKKYRAVMELWDSAHQFKKGHQLTIVVRSSLFPANARNLGTLDPIVSGTKSVIQKVKFLSSPSSPATLSFYTVK